MGGDSSQALIFKGETVGHVQIVNGDLLAVERGQLERRLWGEADACHLGAAWEKDRQCLVRLMSFNHRLTFFKTVAKIQSVRSVS